MRLHRLELTAFGPFARSVRIDMDAVAADGLFLLHGETGAGKTTLLDAVAFALYGTVPGARGEVKRLRCDLADPTDATVVVLEATIAGRRLMISRSPAYERPKQRGVGTTTQPAKVSLRWVPAAPGEAVPDGLTRADEVGSVVAELLGMSADQFFQVVLLPQGEFARFLRAGTMERQELLEKLFDTVRFQRLEQAFAEQRREAGAALADADRQVGEHRARVLQAAGWDEADVAGVDVAELDVAGVDLAEAGLAVLDVTAADIDAGNVAAGVIAADPAEAVANVAGEPRWLSVLLRDVDQAAAGTRRAAASARTRREASAQTWADAQHRDRLVRRVLELREQSARLDGERATDELRVAAIAAAERAGEAVRADRLVRTAAVRRDEAAAPVASLAADVPSIHRADEDVPRLRREADRVRETAGALGTMTELDAVQRADRASADEVATQIEDIEAQLEAWASERGELPDRRAEIEARLAEVQRQADRTDSLDAAVLAATDVEQAARALPELRQGCAQADAAHRAAVDQHQRMRDERQQLIERRIAGMAAELAGNLIDGLPCAVCGAVDHPTPATVDADQVDSADVDAVHARERAAEQSRSDANDVLVAAQQELTTAEAAARGHDLESAQEALRVAREQQRLAQQATQALPDLREERAALQRRADKVADDYTAAIGRRDALRANRGALRRAIEARETQLADAAAGFASVAARRDGLLDTADALDAWADAIETAGRAHDEWVAADDARAEAVRHGGFTDLTQALTAAELNIDQARQEHDAYRQQVAIVADGLAAPELADLPGAGELEPVDLAPLQEATERAAAAADQAASDSAVAQRRLADARVAADGLRAAITARAPIARKAADATGLADLVAGRGQNARALSLRAYVLALKLRLVADSASQRLEKMSSGRYRFVHTEGKEAHGRAGGLGLDILDAYSGQARSTKTLSGGESFLASLALALALADVVAAESGARLLDTLFIDEGFGSLDSDTLEMVMGTLDELRTGGRVVGVVSHVDEMRQRIPNRVHVIKGVAGSDVVTATG